MKDTLKQLFPEVSKWIVDTDADGDLEIRCSHPVQEEEVLTRLYDRAYSLEQYFNNKGWSLIMSESDEDFEIQITQM